jgi:hypothetical protein
MQRRAIRYGAAVVSATIAAIYFLIGLGLLTVITPAADDPSLFGFSAGSAFLLGALLLVAFDRRVLWLLGAALQLLVLWAYFAVAPDRTPAFEVWGITLRIIQLPLTAALVYLSLRAPEPRAEHPKLHLERSRPT